MNHQQVLHKILKTINQWEAELSSYEFEKLLLKPHDDSWSLGQVYMHLIQSTTEFHVKQIEIASSTDEQKTRRKNVEGFMAFHVLKSLPPIKIKVPPSEDYTPKQPQNKEQILNGLIMTKEVLTASMKYFQNNKGGKTKHPGLSYLNSIEWLKLIEMHFRHHFRQKARIDQYLVSIEN